jgi:hypothetical protein
MRQILFVGLLIAGKTGASRVESAKANDSEGVAFEYPVQE